MQPGVSPIREAAFPVPAKPPMRVVTEIKGNKNDKYLTVVYRDLKIENGELVFSGEPITQRVDTYEWVRQ